MTRRAHTRFTPPHKGKSGRFPNRVDERMDEGQTRAHPRITPTTFTGWRDDLRFVFRASHISSTPAPDYTFTYSTTALSTLTSHTMGFPWEKTSSTGIRTRTWYGRALKTNGSDEIFGTSWSKFGAFTAATSAIVGASIVGIPSVISWWTGVPSQPQSSLWSLAEKAAATTLLVSCAGSICATIWEKMIRPSKIKIRQTELEDMFLREHRSDLLNILMPSGKKGSKSAGWLARGWSSSTGWWEGTS